MKKMNYLKSLKDTSEVKVSDRLVDQIIGQSKAVEIIKKAAKQKRNVLLVGIPGTGKSMLAQAMSELLPVQELEDLLVVSNPDDENRPKVKIVKAGEGKKEVQENKLKARMTGGNINIISTVILMIGVFLLLFYGTKFFSDVIVAALLIGLLLMGAAMIFAMQLGRTRALGGGDFENEKLLVDNSGKKTSPFIEATGARAGALLGDVRHDPYQSGGLGTPAHLRVEAGAIHKANKGVLFIDEVGSLNAKAQQELLTAMQEKKFSITGQSEMSSGALVKTEPVPCDFILVAAGNYQDIRKMHPALRSRIRGYGYEVYMEESIADNEENREKVVQFIAQEVKKDGKIPHFDESAVDEIITEARKRSGRKNKLTLKLRELGGLVRAAGDLAVERNKKIVSSEEVIAAKKLSRTLEQQAVQQVVEARKEYQVFETKGAKIGKVNGLAVMGEAGIVLPIVAEVTPAASREEGKIIATGKLGEIAKEAVDNVSAVLKKHVGKDISTYDIHIQFLQTYEGVEGDSASISVATVVISALENIPIKQDIAMTGSLSVRGEVLPVGGVTQKVEAAVESGIKKILIPRANMEDLVLSDDVKKKVKIIPVSNISQVLKESLSPNSKTKALLSKIEKEF
jgi:Lon-like ATP-dependent protease